ncbi:hypothetical protein PR003_g6683 [Phytophthora rubi]|uniref:Uncharacterized protein n=1 Tax=Phytophthora rubi TaxID=129364 RepID=A0A6A3NNV3_9STRA|nr:hypothetical protein PR002_g6670 [Phytophthora rubi]KAE9042129.1 hypothetical protein PR001_g6323 [Phytophthora rubi]KAE9347877.1 hypothetical protein PR003_g6683 [Phytophthora rubi]
MKTLQQQSCILASILLIAIVQAGWVELYKDADHKHKLSRIEDIEYDQCYSFACAALDNTVTSAKWGGLSEKMANGDDAMISFYTDRDCLEHNIWWRIKTQSDDDLYFPSNFRLDGINDEISAFMVWHTKKTRVGSGWDICTTESAEIDVGGNATTNSTFGSGSGALDNNTITALA